MGLHGNGYFSWCENSHQGRTHLSQRGECEKCLVPERFSSGKITFYAQDVTHKRAKIYLFCIFFWHHFVLLRMCVRNVPE